MLHRVLALVLLSGPALAQLDCDEVELLPLDVFTGSSAAGAPWLVRHVALDGDVAVVDSPEDPVGTVGERGALYVHARTAGGWVLEQRLDVFDALAPQTGTSDFADRWALAGGAIFARYRDGGVAGSPHRIAVFERVAGVWQKTSTLDADPAFFEAGTFGSVIAAAEGRLVVGSFDSVAFQGFASGTLETFESAPLGGWQRADLTTGTNFDPAAPRQIALRGDRLAIADGDEVVVFGKTSVGWREDHVVDTTMLPGAGPGTSVALAGDRLVVGGGADATTRVYDLSAGAAPALMQEILVDDFPARDVTLPHGSLVAAEGDFLVVGVLQDVVGRPTIRHFEWMDGEYRVFDALRAGAGVAAVALDGGRALVAAPWSDSTSEPAADARLETRRVDGSRAVPYCVQDGELLAAGSGRAPFDSARLHGYDLPAGAVALLVGGAAAGTTPFAGTALCIDASQGIARLSGPVATTATGSFVVETSELELSGLSTWLVAGGSVHLQAVYRDGAATRTTNALRVTLCD